MPPPSAAAALAYDRWSVGSSLGGSREGSLGAPSPRSKRTSRRAGCAAAAAGRRSSANPSHPHRWDDARAGCLPRGGHRPLRDLGHSGGPTPCRQRRFEHPSRDGGARALAFGAAVRRTLEQVAVVAEEVDGAVAENLEHAIPGSAARLLARRAVESVRRELRMRSAACVRARSCGGAGPRRRRATGRRAEGGRGGACGRRRSPSQRGTPPPPAARGPPPGQQRRVVDATGDESGERDGERRVRLRRGATESLKGRRARRRAATSTARTPPPSSSPIERARRGWPRRPTRRAHRSRMVGI